MVLDVLRAVAVLLVLGRHLEPCPREQSAVLHAVTSVWSRGGWVGVDLFFVLSGFLVSGLLFREHKLHGELRVKQFFVRRGLKIYPAFITFLIAGALWKLAAGGQIGVRRFAAEIGFVQNYLPSIWFHTWSLAVEEHFYILLPFVLLLLLRKDGDDPVRTLWVLLIVIGGSCLLFRSLDAAASFDFYRHATPTHKRIDSLFAGVLLAAIYHYRRERMEAAVRRFGWLMLPLGIALMSLPFFFALEKTPWMYGIGYTLIYTGGALLLAVAAAGRDLKHPVWRGAAKIGMDSYSIYLWHAVALTLIAEPVRRMLPAAGNWLLFAAIYFVSAIGLGILMARLVEWPVLRIRDRYFPSRSIAAPKRSATVRTETETMPQAAPG